MHGMVFPEGFLWGVATASYQIEGTPANVGGGSSVWDMFAKRPGATHEFESGKIACDHYNRWKEDVALMKELGIPNYRLSISWPRILPDGAGKVDERGLAFYDQLLDEMLASGVKPHVTLYHWDLPYELYCRGGWLNREILSWWENYVNLVVDKLSDRVESWMTINEPQVFVGMGLQDGAHAPGDRLNWAEVLRASHHVLTAHGIATQIIRAKGKKPNAEVGWAAVGMTAMPATDSPDDIEAGRQAMFACDVKNMWSNTWWDDPIFFGHYPEDGLSIWGHEMPKGWEKDIDTIHQTPDFFGMNTYNGRHYRMNEEGKPEPVAHAQGIGRTIYHWPVTPTCLYWGPRYFYERYGKPIMVTENGVGLSDWVHLDGKVHDPGRIDFLDRYISQFAKAAADGVKVKGYFQWSLMDNFEWQEGYKHRFGLVYVDYQTQQRIPKDSAYWYRDLIKANGSTITGMNV